VQPDGNDTIATPLRIGMTAGRSVSCASAISGLQVPSVIDADAAIDACRRSGGTGHVVADADVWAMQRRLAVEEGLFVEPAAAVAVVGALGALSRGEVAADDVIVALLTGVGFKDSASVTRMIGEGPCDIVEPGLAPVSQCLVPDRG
jgi:threonine synthase